MTNITDSSINFDVHPLVKIDYYHAPFTFHWAENFNIYDTGIITTYQSYNFTNANFLLIYEDIKQLECSKYSGVDVDTSTNDLYSQIYSSFDKNVPMKVFKKKKARKDPWMNNELKKLINKKTKYFVKSKRSRDIKWYNKYAEIRKLVKKKYNEARNAYISLLENSIYGNSSFFWHQFKRAKVSNLLSKVMYKGSM